MNYTYLSGLISGSTRALLAAGSLSVLAACAGSSGGDADTPAPPTGQVNLSASATTVANGGSATLTWSGTGISNCMASGGWSGSRPSSGSENVGPLSSNTSFILSCDSTTGSVSDSISISIDNGSGSGDPQLDYATYLGGADFDTIRDVAVGPDGSVYVAGGSESSDFPVQNGSDSTFNGVFDVIVMKFTPNGTLVWSTFIGGPTYDRAYAIEVDPSGNVYVAGRAGSGYPTTPGVVQRNFGGDTVPNPAYGPQDGFVTKLNSSGQVLWSTYLGGDDRAIIRDIDVDASGNVYFALTQVSSSNASAAHLITANSYQTAFAGGTDGIVGKLRNDGSVVEWGTYLGGSNEDSNNPTIRVDQQGNVLVAGYTNSTNMPRNASFGTTLGGQFDMHLTKFLPDGSGIVFGAYIGGSSVDAAETHSLAVDGAGNAYVAAGTSSADFPVTMGVTQTVIAGGSDAFITKVSPQGNLLASGYFGGSGDDYIEGISIGSNGDVFVSGVTQSADLAVTSDALQPQFGGASDGFVARLSSDLSTIVYSTYIGGSTYDLTRSSWFDGDSMHVVGHTNSNDFPVTSNALDGNISGNPNTGNKFTGDGLFVLIDFSQP